MTRPTLVSLATDLGVSRQTVSNVINAPHLVRESTRQRVQAAIEASGYRPSAAAQALRSQKSNTIGLRLYPGHDGINGAIMDRFLHCVVEQAEALGHRVMLFTAVDDDAEVEVLTDLVDRSAIDACLLTGTTADDRRVEALQRAGVRFAAFGRPWGSEDSATHAWADVDGREGVRRATEHLLQRGHEVVGFIGWPEGSGTGDDRHAGWLEAMRAACPGLDDDEFEQFVVRIDDGIAQGVAAMGELAERGCDAAVCASDSLAVGAQEVLRPGHDNAFVPVIGFDDTPVARALGLSSLAQPVEDAATLLVRHLIGPAEETDGTDTQDGPRTESPAEEPAGGAPDNHADAGRPRGEVRRIGVHGHLLTPTLELRRFEPVDLQEVTGG